MKTLALALTLCTFTVFAQTSEDITGPEAEKLFYQLLDNDAVFTENTTCLTTIELENVSCTLQGSHSSCGLEESFTCTKTIE